MHTEKLCEAQGEASVCKPSGKAVGKAKPTDTVILEVQPSEL